MQLADTSGVEIERFDYEQWLTIPATETAVYPFGATWTAPLDRPAIVTVTADVYDARGDSFGVDRATQLAWRWPARWPTGGGGETPADVCRHASRWWLHHCRNGRWPR